MPSSSSCTTDETRGSSLARTDGDDRHRRREARQRRLVARDGREDQPVDGARPHRLDDALLAPRVAVGVGEHRHIAVRREPVLDAADDRRNAGSVMSGTITPTVRVRSVRSDEAAAFGRYFSRSLALRIFSLSAPRDRDGANPD